MSHRKRGKTNLERYMTLQEWEKAGVMEKKENGGEGECGSKQGPADRH